MIKIVDRDTKNCIICVIVIIIIGVPIAIGLINLDYVYNRIPMQLDDFTENTIAPYIRDKYDNITFLDVTIDESKLSSNRTVFYIYSLDDWQNSTEVFVSALFEANETTIGLSLDGRGILNEYRRIHGVLWFYDGWIYHLLGCYNPGIPYSQDDF